MGQGKTVAAAAMDALACRVAVRAERGMVGNVERPGVAVGGEQAREEAANAAVMVMVVVEMAAVAMPEEETAMVGAVTAAAVMEAAAGAVAGRTACTGTRRI